MEQIIDDAIAINYRGRDKDDLAHIVTYVDIKKTPRAKEGTHLYVSPTATKVLTSKFNADFLRLMGLANCEAMELNASFRLVTEDNRKYIITFFDSKYSAGSIAVLIKGGFGTALYTGDFSFYPDFCKLPPIIPLLQRSRPLKYLYLDTTYYEQQADFVNLDTNIKCVVSLIKANRKSKIHIFAEKFTMDPIICEIASRINEKMYVDDFRMHTIKLLGYEQFFTTDSSKSRIFVAKAFVQRKINSNNEMNIVFYRHPEYSSSFIKNGVYEKTNMHAYHFYCHSTHEECCKLISSLKPEHLIHLHSAPIIDPTKVRFTSIPLNPTILGNSTFKKNFLPLNKKRKKDDEHSPSGSTNPRRMKMILAKDKTQQFSPQTDNRVSPMATCQFVSKSSIEINNIMRSSLQTNDVVTTQTGDMQLDPVNISSKNLLPCGSSLSLGGAELKKFRILGPSEINKILPSSSLGASKSRNSEVVHDGTNSSMGKSIPEKSPSSMQFPKKEDSDVSSHNSPQSRIKLVPDVHRSSNFKTALHSSGTSNKVFPFKSPLPYKSQKSDVKKMSVAEVKEITQKKDLSTISKPEMPKEMCSIKTVLKAQPNLQKVLILKQSNMKKLEPNLKTGIQKRGPILIDSKSDSFHKESIVLGGKSDTCKILQRKIIPELYPICEVISKISNDKLRASKLNENQIDTVVLEDEKPKYLITSKVENISPMKQVKRVKVLLPSADFKVIMKDEKLDTKEFSLSINETIKAEGTTSEASLSPKKEEGLAENKPNPNKLCHTFETEREITPEKAVAYQAQVVPNPNVNSEIGLVEEERTHILDGLHEVSTISIPEKYASFIDIELERLMGQKPESQATDMYPLCDQISPTPLKSTDPHVKNKNNSLEVTMDNSTTNIRRISKSSCANENPPPQELYGHYKQHLLNKYSINPCYVNLNKNTISWRYFYSDTRKCYLPKDYGFSKIEARRRYEYKFYPKFLEFHRKVLETTGS